MIVMMFMTAMLIIGETASTGSGLPYFRKKRSPASAGSNLQFMDRKKRSPASIGSSLQFMDRKKRSPASVGSSLGRSRKKIPLFLLFQLEIFPKKYGFRSHLTHF